MKFLFDDESFSFETLRAAGFATYGGADLGEVLVTASAITGGDEASWHRAWKATAQRVQEIGEQAQAAGHWALGQRAGGPAARHQVMFDWLDTTLTT